MSAHGTVLELIDDLLSVEFSRSMFFQSSNPAMRRTSRRNAVITDRLASLVVFTCVGVICVRHRSMISPVIPSLVYQATFFTRAYSSIAIDCLLLGNSHCASVVLDCLHALLNGSGCKGPACFTLFTLELDRAHPSFGNPVNVIIGLETAPLGFDDVLKEGS